MLKAIVVEDELYIRKGLVKLINNLNKDITIVGQSGTVNEAIRMTNLLEPELVFLDINLPDGNAFDYIEKTKHIEYKVIFITAYDEFAIQALKSGAIDYILKPVDVEELENAINKALRLSYDINESKRLNLEILMNKSKDKLILSLSDRYQLVKLEELMYCKSDKGYTTFYLSNGKSYIASKPLKEFENQLIAYTFARTHQSYIININYIDRYDKRGFCILKNGGEIPVSHTRKEQFISWLLN